MRLVILTLVSTVLHARVIGVIQAQLASDLKLMPDCLFTDYSTNFILQDETVSMTSL
jgi:hypothetical protein